MGLNPATMALIAAEIHLAGGLHAAVAVNPDGTTAYSLLVDGQPCDDHCGHYPEHERLGPLPAIYAARLARVRCRCGGARADGGSCRVEVRSPGQRCHWHAR
jgi:hypothetical protein